MKKLLVLVGTLFVLSPLCAMENRSVTVFTAEDYGIDVSHRQSVIEFYWHKKNELDTRFMQAKTVSSSQGADFVKHLFDEIVNDAERLSAGSERDLNGDKFAHIFGGFIDDVATCRYRFCQTQEDPVVCSKKIQKYRDQERYLSDRFCDFLTTELVWSTEQKIAEVQTILEKARFLSSDSQRELREVELAHNLSPFIRTLERELGQLQSELVSEKNSRREKRDLEQESDILKRLRFE